MADLIARAEEALLGALIGDARQLEDMPEDLDAGSFTGPTRKAVWAAITGLGEAAQGASGPQFANLILATTDDPAFTSDYLTRLALSAPTPGAAASYARMVIEAAVTHDLGVASAGSPSYAACLTAARSAFPEDIAIPEQPSDERVIREEKFLAGLIGQQALIDWISMDPDAFTAPGLRAIYQAILAVDRHGELVDELTVAWQAARIVANDDYFAGRVTTLETIADAIPPGTISRLASSRIDPLTALEAGRDLLADHARTQIAAARDVGYDAAAGSRRTLSSQAPPLLEHPPAPPQLRHAPQLGQGGS